MEPLVTHNHRLKRRDQISVPREVFYLVVVLCGSLSLVLLAVVAYSVRRRTRNAPRPHPTPWTHPHHRRDEEEAAGAAVVQLQDRRPRFSSLPMQQPMQQQQRPPDSTTPLQNPPPDPVGVTEAASPTDPAAAPAPIDLIITTTAEGGDTPRPTSRLVFPRPPRPTGYHRSPAVPTTASPPSSPPASSRVATATVDRGVGEVHNQGDTDGTRMWGPHWLERVRSYFASPPQQPGIHIPPPPPPPSPPLPPYPPPLPSLAAEECSSSSAYEDPPMAMHGAGDEVVVTPLAPRDGGRPAFPIVRGVGPAPARARNIVAISSGGRRSSSSSDWNRDERQPGG